jgi:hypothetical protein
MHLKSHSQLEEFNQQRRHSDPSQLSTSCLNPLNDISLFSDPFALSYVSPLTNSSSVTCRIINDSSEDNTRTFLSSASSLSTPSSSSTITYSHRFPSMDPINNIRGNPDISIEPLDISDWQKKPRQSDFSQCRSDINYNKNDVHSKGSKNDKGKSGKRLPKLNGNRRKYHMIA